MGHFGLHGYQLYMYLYLLGCNTCESYVMETSNVSFVADVTNKKKLYHRERETLNKLPCW